MFMALTTKNKIGLIDGSLLQSFESSPSSNLAWTICNNMVLSWILNSVLKEITTSIIYIDLAHEMWNDLMERFFQRNDH
jgi:hypothetical protein